MRAHDDFLAPDRPLITRMRAPIPDVRLNLPPYEWVEFPKMALKRATKEDVDAFLAEHENFDERIGKMRYTKRAPKLGSLIALRDPESQQIIVFQDAGEENAFYDAHPEVERIDVAPGKPVPLASEAELEEFRAWKAGKTAKANALQSAGAHVGGPAEEKASLAAQLRDKGVEPDKRWGVDKMKAELAKFA